MNRRIKSLFGKKAFWIGLLGLLLCISLQLQAVAEETEAAGTTQTGSQVAQPPNEAPIAATAVKHSREWAAGKRESSFAWRHFNKENSNSNEITKVPTLLPSKTEHTPFQGWLDAERNRTRSLDGQRNVPNLDIEQSHGNNWRFDHHRKDAGAYRHNDQKEDVIYQPRTRGYTSRGHGRADNNLYRAHRVPENSDNSQVEIQEAVNEQEQVVWQRGEVNSSPLRDKREGVRSHERSRERLRNQVNYMPRIKEVVESEPASIPRHARVEPKSSDSQQVESDFVRRSHAWFDRARERIRIDNKRHSESNVHLVPDLQIDKPDGTRIAATVMDRRHKHPRHRHYPRYTRHYGYPSYGIIYYPRPVRDFSVGYWIGYGDGFYAGYHYKPVVRPLGRPLYTHFYYGHYFDDPYYAGFWYSGYYPNVYIYYGWVPRWCNPPSVIVYSSDPYRRYSEPPRYYYLERYRVDSEGIDLTLRDIRRAWLDGDIDLLARHLQEDDKISVYFENDYSYSISVDEYYSMTLDAMSTVETSDIEFSRPVWISSQDVFVTGRHIFVDPENDRHTVYLSFRLERRNGGWYITGVGSSPKPIKHDYDDFRYQ